MLGLGIGALPAGGVGFLANESLLDFLFNLGGLVALNSSFLGLLRLNQVILGDVSLELADHHFLLLAILLA